MKSCVPCNSHSSRRAAMTLIEVVAGIALLGTVLATTVLAQARLLRQHQRALLKLQAVEAVDRLLTQWSTEQREIVAPASGTLIANPKVTWTTQIQGVQRDGELSISVVELTAVADNDPRELPPLVRVELAVPVRDQP